MTIYRTRFAVAAMAAALLLTSTSTIALADEGGSTTGASCLVEAAASDGVYRTTGATVVPNEFFVIFASGYAPDGIGELLIEDLDFGGSSVGDALFDSEGTALGDFYFTVGDEGTWRFTVSQETPACAAAVDVEVLPLTDILDSIFLVHIKWLFVEGITSGCSATAYCPNGQVTRGQMATFLRRALNLPATSTDYFTDDEGSTHEDSINRLRAAGITAGCGGSRFCPDGVVTRAQMATFLVRGFHLPATSTDYFTDDEGSIHEVNINRLKASGVTAGCTATTYCPSGAVTRGQMAAFLKRAIE